MKSPRDLQVSAPITASPVVGDLDGDGALELLVLADRLYGWRLPSLDPLAGYPKWIGGPSASTPVLLHREGESPGLLFGSDDDRLYGVDASGADLPGFPVATGGDVFTTPLIADLDRSGQPCVIFGSDDGGLYVLSVSAAVSKPAVRFSTGGFVSSTPALLPRPAEGYDLVFGSWDGSLYCLRGEDPRACLWRVETGHLIWSSPAVGDFNGDGSPEVVVLNDRIHLLTSQGQPLRSFPLPLGGMAIGSPAIGDLGGNGQPVIVAAADRLYAFHSDGSELPGFPLDTGAPFWASPILADFDGDGYDEIVAADYDGFLHIITWQGRPVEGFPRRLGACIVSSPIAADLDRDSLLELVICTFDGRVAILPTRGRTSQWPGFRGPLGNGMLPSGRRAQGLRPGIQNRGSGGGAAFRRQTQRQRADATRMKLDASLPQLAGLEVKRWEVRRRNFAGLILYELELEAANAGSFQRGLLHFQRNGQWHPSPLLRNGSRLIGRFPPYRRWSKVPWYVTVEQCDQKEFRFPSHGTLTFRTR